MGLNKQEKSHFTTNFTIGMKMDNVTSSESRYLNFLWKLVDDLTREGCRKKPTNQGKNLSQV